MSKPKDYILNIQDILQIPESSFDNFLVDLKKWHKAARDTVNLLEIIAKATDKPVPREFVTMRWIDDGKHDAKIIIKATKSEIKESEKDDKNNQRP